MSHVRKFFHTTSLIITLLVDTTNNNIISGMEKKIMKQAPVLCRYNDENVGHSNV